jgi:uncharacterized protein involved in exopolysaccharide biosynthesis
MDERHQNFQQSQSRSADAAPNANADPILDDQLDVAGVWRALWHAKWIIAATAMGFAAVAVAYALSATEWFEAEVWLAPAEEQSMRNLNNPLGGSLGGLVGGLTGISIGGGGNAEPLAVLESRGFLGAFIQENGLLEQIAAVAQLGEDGEVDLRDAVEFFRDAVLDVEENRQTRIVVLTVQWTDPATAAKWANQLVARLNEQMRQRALEQADSSVNYLKLELERAHFVTLQQSVGRLLEAELQKAMLARVNDEFAFRVLDAAQPPNRRSSPRRTQIVAFATLTGVFLASFVVALRWAVRDKRLDADRR